MTVPVDVQTSERVDVDDSTQVAGARALAVGAARSAGVDAAAVDRIALVATELAQNLHLHAVGGEFIVTVSPADDRLMMIAVDKGPGVVDFERCLVDGFSTTATMGTGLGAVQRLAAGFDAFSEYGSGTAVSATFTISGAPLRADPFDVAAIGFPVAGEVVNGDSFSAVRDGSRIVVLLADGLGHGPFAAHASAAAARQLRLTGAAGPLEVLQRVNDELAKTRGAAVTVAELALDVARDGGTIRTCGLGNVGAVVAAADGATKRIVTSHGTAGARRAARLVEQTDPFPASGTLVLHTDGLTARWNLDGKAALLRHGSAVIAAVLWRDYARGTDDSLVVVIKAWTGRS